MRYLLLLLMGILVVSCSPDRAPLPPTTPDAVPVTPAAALVARPAFVWAVVADENGQCILGATARIVGGVYDGRTGTQERPCDIWDSEGAIISNLDPAVDVLVRASAPGYVTQERKVTPVVSGMAVIFRMIREK